MAGIKPQGFKRSRPTQRLRSCCKKLGSKPTKRRERTKIRGKKESKSVDVKTNDNMKTCAYCNKAGHNILKCFKLIKDQASAKADGNLDTKKGIVAPTITRQDEIVEENTGFSSFPAVARITGTFSAFPIYFREISDTTKAALAFGAKKNIDKNSLLVDTGASFSIVKDYGLMSELKSCSPVTFDGLQGTLTVNQSGSLLGICQAYYHPDAVANIISFSKVEDLGLEIAMALMMNSS